MGLFLLIVIAILAISAIISAIVDDNPVYRVLAIPLMVFVYYWAITGVINTHFEKKQECVPISQNP